MHQRNERSFITRMNVHFDRYTQRYYRRRKYSFGDHQERRKTSSDQCATESHLFAGFQYMAFSSTSSGGYTEFWQGHRDPYRGP